MTSLEIAIVANDRKPRLARVILFAIAGLAVSAGCKVLYDVLMDTQPAHPHVAKVITAAVFAVLITHLSIKPMMNECGQRWR
jgi:drug/metabolite transporter superfamily protein YnfA